MARALGLAAAVHARALRQPARAGVPRRPGHLPGPRRGRGLPRRTTRASSSCRWSSTAASWPCAAPTERLRRRARRPALRRRPGGDRHRPLPGPVHPAGRRRTSRRRSRSCTAPSTAGPRRSARRARWSSSGGGNTGYQIAEELARSREVHLSIGSRQTPLPQRILGRDLFALPGALGADGQDRRLAPGAAPQGPRDADRLEPARARASRASACASGSRARKATA